MSETAINRFDPHYSSSTYLWIKLRTTVRGEERIKRFEKIRINRVDSRTLFQGTIESFPSSSFPRQFGCSCETAGSSTREREVINRSNYANQTCFRFPFDIIPSLSRLIRFSFVANRFHRPSTALIFPDRTKGNRVLPVPRTTSNFTSCHATGISRSVASKRVYAFTVVVSTGFGGKNGFVNFSSHSSS